MPELPEVETISHGMRLKLLNKRVKNVVVRRHDLRWPIPQNFRERVQGLMITNIQRRAKYILIHTNGGQGVLMHLGMSGRIQVSDGPTPPPLWATHDHVHIDLDDGTWFRYHDPRRFGTIQLVDNHAFNNHALLNHLGMEPLSQNFTGQYLHDYVTGRKSPIKSLIMDQRLVVGVGNIYACEALFLAKISPTSLGHHITLQQAENLSIAIKVVLQDAIQAGGSTLKDYRTSDGSMGYFQYNFKVYDKVDHACPSCTVPIMRIVQSGRSTFYCPSCQK